MRVQDQRYEIDEEQALGVCEECGQGQAICRLEVGGGRLQNLCKACYDEFWKALTEVWATI